DPRYPTGRRRAGSLRRRPGGYDGGGAKPVRTRPWRATDTIRRIMQFNRQAPPDAGDERAAREDERSVRRTALRGAWGIVAFWMAMLAGMYLIFGQVESRKQVTLAAHVGAAGELVIPRG